MPVMETTALYQSGPTPQIALNAISSLEENQSINALDWRMPGPQHSNPPCKPAEPAVYNVSIHFTLRGVATPAILQLLRVP